MNNTELIKALRYCAEHEGCNYYIAKDCPRESTWVCGADCEQILMQDAADALEAADKRIAELEAQLPKEGEWIEDEYGYIHCSRCRMEWDEPEHPQTNFCPNCGARMQTVTDCHTLDER